MRLEAVMLPLPPCPVGLDDPRPLRELLLQGALAELATNGALRPRVIVAHPTHAVVADLPMTGSGPRELARLWGAVYRRPGALRTFRQGLLALPGPDGDEPHAAVLERTDDGRTWLGAAPLVRRGAPDLDREGPTGDARLDARIATWTEGFDDAGARASVKAPPPSARRSPELEAGASVVVEVMPLADAVPRDLDGLALWFDQALRAHGGLLRAALASPPVVVTVRDGRFERWILKKPQPATLDDLVRNLCALGSEPEVVVVLRTGSVLHDGAQRASVSCAIERRGSRLVRQIPLVPGRDPSAPLWVDPVRYPVEGPEGWIGVRPGVELDLRPDGWSTGES